MPDWLIVVLGIGAGLAAIALHEAVLHWGGDSA